jgi:phage shock protein A
MTIFSRLSDIVNANINALLDRAEDPAKLIRLVIQEMEDTLVEVRSSAVRTIAERREIERRITTLAAERDEWERKAEFALSRNREDLARGALMAKASASRSLAAEQQILAGLVAGLAAQSEDLAKLQAKLAEAKTREKSLATRRATATNQLKIRARLHDGRVGDAFAKFEKIERALDEMEGKVEAYDLGQPRSLADEFADMEADETVKAELEALKAKLNNNNSTKE